MADDVRREVLYIEADTEIWEVTYMIFDLKDGSEILFAQEGGDHGSLIQLCLDAQFGEDVTKNCVGTNPQRKIDALRRLREMPPIDDTGYDLPGGGWICYKPGSGLTLRYSHGGYESNAVFEGPLREYLRGIGIKTEGEEFKVIPEK